MMACKAWLFDRDPEAAVLRSILASKKPADQKTMGRKVPGFNETIWEAVSIKIVVASQIARAEVNPQLATIYRKSGSRIFVEGSPYDRIWGVGLRWNERLIENERNWNGKNKLGLCHGFARHVLWEQEMAKRAGAIAEQTSTEAFGEDAMTVSSETPGEDVMDNSSELPGVTTETQAWLDFKDVTQPGQKT